MICWNDVGRGGSHTNPEDGPIAGTDRGRQWGAVYKKILNQVLSLGPLPPQVAFGKAAHLVLGREFDIFHDTHVCGLNVGNCTLLRSCNPCSRGMCHRQNVLVVMVTPPPSPPRANIGESFTDSLERQLAVYGRSPGLFLGRILWRRFSPNF